MFVILVIHDNNLSTFYLILFKDYVPGEPGAAWSEEEVRIVRLKVQALLRHEPEARAEMGMFGSDVRAINEMSIFRLSFHDCLAYVDGPGVCDGCLDWHNMGNKAPNPFPSVDTYCQHQHPKPKGTDNNGLAYLVEFLEKIYKTTDFPPGAPNLDVSLFGSGKSRADLWQFATNVALESTLERSNFGCRHDYFQRQQVPLLENEGKGHAFGVWKCKIKMNKPFKFQYGRADCKVDHPDEPYRTDRVEQHSDAHANIGTILSDLKAGLGMSAKDFIALNSIHGMINPFSQASIGTKYTWMGSGPYLSNIYYKILANRPTYNIGGSIGFDMKSGQDHNLWPYSVGDENGNPVAMWGLRVSCSDCWNTTQSWAGGPCHWRPSMPTAPDCPNREKIMPDCFDKFENGQRQIKTDHSCKDIQFSPEGVQIGNSGTINVDTSDAGTGGWSNMFMLNYEAGMYKKFDIDEAAMRGTGCPGINLQNPDEMWTDGWDCLKANAVILSRVNQCPKQDLADETGKPIYKIVEEFADDHDVWADAFMEAFPRMQSIGYTDLKDGPDNSWLGYYTLEDMGANIGSVLSL